MAFRGENAAIEHLNYCGEQEGKSRGVIEMDNVQVTRRGWKQLSHLPLCQQHIYDYTFSSFI